MLLFCFVFLLLYANHVPISDSETEALFFNASHWDVYALAMMLWSLWFRRDPWPRSFSAHKIMAMVTRGRRPPLSESAKPPPPAETTAEATAEASLGAEEASPGSPAPASPAESSILPTLASETAPSPLQSYHSHTERASATTNSSIHSTSESTHDKLAAWGDLISALPLLPALERLIERMWSHSHYDRPELPIAMDIFAREVCS